MVGGVKDRIMSLFETNTAKPYSMNVKRDQENQRQKNNRKTT